MNFRFRLAAWSVFCVFSLTVVSHTLADEQAVGELPQDAVAKLLSQASGDSPRLKDFAELTKGAKKYEGLFTLHEKDGHLYAEIGPAHFDKMFIAPMAIARGVASAGTPLNFGDEWILKFKKINDREVQLIRKNVRYDAPKNSPLGRAVEQNYTDSILMTLPIVSKTQNNHVVVDFSRIFLANFAQVPFGNLDRSRTRYHKIKTFPNNVELQVEATFSGGGGGGRRYRSSNDDGIIDPRGITVVLHYSLVKRPESSYKPRLADPRVGYFLNATKDFASTDPTTNFVRKINRWNIEKANPASPMSPPKKQLVWWVENTVPHEYRPHVEAGILEWNKAFEKIGIQNALGVRWQNEQDEFDPEDINYCTFRWITTPNTFAMSGLRSDPITGEMIDGDVIFDASWIRAWKQEYAMLVGKPTASADGNGFQEPNVLAMGEIISPIMALKHGYGLPTPLIKTLQATGRLPQNEYSVLPAHVSPIHQQLAERTCSGGFASCQCAATKRHEYALAALALASAKSKDEGGKPKDVEFPEEFIGQAIKEVVMHEVGHSLGLRHNFKASTMLSLDDVNDPSITRKKGMVGSVMDYAPLNIVVDGKKQGDFASTTIGPYDYWAIEYAYKPITGDEKQELAKIASRSPESDYVFATDEDMYLANDPLVNTYDLGNDPLRYAKHRVALADSLMKRIDEHVVADGESWARLRSAFSALLAQYGNASYLASSYIGGEHVARDFKGGENSRDPITPVNAAKQREALQFVVEKIFRDDTFQFDPSVLRKLAVENWYHWGSYDSPQGSSGMNIYDRVLGIQRIPLGHCLSADVLKRLQNQALMAKDGENPLSVDEIFRSLTDNIWTELYNDSKDKCCSTFRRNLQRQHLSHLSRIALGGSGESGAAYFISFGSAQDSYPADAKSLARMHLKEIQKMIEHTLETPEGLNDSTRAHLEESQEQIAKVLSAQFTVSRL